MTAPDARAQIRSVTGLLGRVLGADLAGVYLFGSAALGGLRPHSDLDVMAVSKRRTTDADKRALVSDLLTLSGDPRYLEVTIVVAGEVRPWRHPARMDFQYGDWWRAEFEGGDLAPWACETGSDLTSLIRMVLLADTPLAGPSPAELFEPIPRRDYAAALGEGIDGLLRDVDSDTRNVVLTLARVWHGLVTDEVVPKDVAAGWALDRLPDEHRGVLAEARAVYLGEGDDWSEDPVPRARSYARYVAARAREEGDLGRGSAPV